MNYYGTVKIFSMIVWDTECQELQTENAGGSQTLQAERKSRTLQEFKPERIYVYDAELRME